MKMKLVILRPNDVPILDEDEAGHATKDEQLALNTIYNWLKTKLSSPPKPRTAMINP